MSDDGRSIAAHPCDVIWITLQGASAGGWQFVQTSDPVVLAVVPLPLPHLADGGTEAVYLAKSDGVAVVSSTGLSLPCAPTAACPTPSHWAVTVTVGSSGSSTTFTRVRTDPASADVSQFGGLNASPALGLMRSAHITAVGRLQGLVRLLNALPAFPSGGFNCPMNDGSYYEVAFHYSDQSVETVRLDATGCQGMYLDGAAVAVAWAAGSPEVFSAITDLLGAGAAAAGSSP